MRLAFKMFFIIYVLVFAIQTEASNKSKSIFEHKFPGLKNEISVDLRGMDIVDVLKFLAIEGDLNIMMAKGISGPVDLLIEDVKIGDAFEILLSLNGLAFEVQGNVIKVIFSEDFRALQGIDFYDQRQTVIYQLKYASAEKVGALLGNIKSDVGKIVYDGDTGMVVMVDIPEKIKEMQEIIEKSDIATISRILPTETKVFELKYAKIEDIETQISEALTLDVGTMKSDIRTNRFVITDLPHQMKIIETIIEAFDRKTRGVFIEAKIVQVTLSDSYKWGVDWSKIFGVDKSPISVTPDINMPLGLTTFGKITVADPKSKLSLILESLESVGETRILSNPHIAVEEGKEATINVVTQQPYSETTTTTTDSATTASSEFTFVDVGVKLTVTPTINSDGYISMAISPEVSSITSFFPSDTDTNRVPVVETANAETTVLVKSGTTVIIAGMIKDTKTKSSNKVPKLGNIPILGKLFSNESDVIQRTETIVFLTPNIVTGEESYLLEQDKPKRAKGIRQ